MCGKTNLPVKCQKSKRETRIKNEKMTMDSNPVVGAGERMRGCGQPDSVGGQPRTERTREFFGGGRKNYVFPPEEEREKLFVVSVTGTMAPMHGP